jgi:SRSO17 transposase
MATMAAVKGDGAAAVRERLEEFAAGVLAEAMNRPVQMANGALYLRGLLEDGQRKSLEPLVARLGDEADYQSLQQFLTDSPWQPQAVCRAVAERVAPELGVEAWVLDDTGFPKDGNHSPGVKRQYSGTLGKIGNCQIGVSLHAVGKQGTVPLGWALYLPADWCDDDERRRRAKIPADVEFKTKPELGAELVEAAAGFEIEPAPVLADEAYGDDHRLRERLDGAGLRYVVAVGTRTRVFSPQTVFAVPERKAGSGRDGRPRTRLRPDRRPRSVAQIIARLGPEACESITFRDGPERQRTSSRFVFARVRTLAKWTNGTTEQPREEWLIAEWPEGAAAPSAYWLSNLPPETPHEQLARLARLRWKVELDYRQLKGELGLDHYEGRSWLGWHHHTALVTAAHGFLTLERLNPFRPRPA